MMTADFNIGKHATSYPSNVLAQRSGKHIYSIEADVDTDNGAIVAWNEWLGFDKFSAKDSTGFAGKIVQKNVDGTWLVLVTDPGDACLVYTEPLTPYESPAELKLESAFYNKKGDVMRCYELAYGDRFAVSDDAFSGSPAVGSAVSVTGRKLAAAAVPSI
jgi:hypothetical protein